MTGLKKRLKECLTYKEIYDIIFLVDNELKT